jgi:hypothetical protein
MVNISPDSPVQYGGTSLGWWKHRRCNRSFFFTPGEGMLFGPPEPEEDGKWCSWCRDQNTDWDYIPGHQVLTPEEHWKQAVDNAAKALYQASPVSIHAPLWETLSESRKAGYRAVAEQVLLGAANDIRAAAISEVLRLLHTRSKDTLRHVYDNLPMKMSTVS